MLRSSDDDLVFLPQEKFGLDGESAFNIEFVAEVGTPEQAAAPIEEPNEEPSTNEEKILKTKTAIESVPTVATDDRPKATPSNSTPTNTNPESTATNTSGQSATPGVPGGQSNGDEKALQIAEDMPIFPGCEAEQTPLERELCSKRKMTEFVQKNVKYPDIAMKKNTQGKITVSFIVEKNGDITNIKVVGKSLGDGCEDAAIKSVQSMNNFTRKIIGGRQNGRPVRIKYNIPVTFTLLQRGN